MTDGLRVWGNVLSVNVSHENFRVFTTTPVGFMRVKEKVNGRVRSGVKLAVTAPLPSIEKLPRDFEAAGLIDISCATTTVPATGVPSSHLSVAVSWKDDVDGEEDEFGRISIAAITGSSVIRFRSGRTSDPLTVADSITDFSAPAVAARSRRGTTVEPLRATPKTLSPAV